MPGAGHAADCWFDEPLPGDRQSWAVPSGHGTCQGLDLELLNPPDDRTFLIEAQHPEFEDALRDDQEMVVGGEQFSPRLHVTLHQVVASQLLADDPPETWQAVQRLVGLGYDWHNIIHMIAAVVSDDLDPALNEHHRSTRATMRGGSANCPATRRPRRHSDRDKGRFIAAGPCRGPQCSSVRGSYSGSTNSSTFLARATCAKHSDISDELAVTDAHPWRPAGGCRGLGTRR